MSERLPNDLEFMKVLGKPQHMLCQVDPIWNKNISPMQILDFPLSDYVKWVYCPLTLERMVDQPFSAVPVGSRGMTEGEGGGEARKICTPWDICYLVGNGSTFGGLREVMLNNGSAMKVSYDDLHYFSQQAKPFIRRE